MQKGGKRRNYVHCLPKDLRQRANLPQLINLLFAQIKSTWLEVCKKHKTRLINWLHGHFYPGFFNIYHRYFLLESSFWYDSSGSNHRRNHNWKGSGDSPSGFIGKSKNSGINFVCQFLNINEKGGKRGNYLHCLPNVFYKKGEPK